MFCYVAHVETLFLGENCHNHINIGELFTAVFSTCSYSNLYLFTLTIGHSELNLLYTPFYEVNNRPGVEYETPVSLPP